MVSTAAIVESVISLRDDDDRAERDAASCTRATMPPGAKRRSKRNATYTMMKTIAMATLLTRRVAELLARLRADPLDAQRLLGHRVGAELRAQAVQELIALAT